MVVGPRRSGLPAHVRMTCDGCICGGLASSVGTVSLFLALLAVLAHVVVLGALGLMIAGEVLQRSCRTPRGVARADRSFLALARVGRRPGRPRWGASTSPRSPTSVPCKLCWYQRICMYPLVVLLGVAAWKGRIEIARATLPLVAIGAAISTYHYLLERFPSWDTVASCDPAAPCTFVWVWRLHYLSIPGMALSALPADRRADPRVTRREPRPENGVIADAVGNQTSSERTGAASTQIRTLAIAAAVVAVLAIAARSRRAPSGARTRPRRASSRRVRSPWPVMPSRPSAPIPTLRSDLRLRPGG